MSGLGEMSSMLLILLIVISVTISNILGYVIDVLGYMINENIIE